MASVPPRGSRPGTPGPAAGVVGHQARWPRSSVAAGSNDARWEFFLDPLPEGRTRLLVRSGGTGAPIATTVLLDYVLWQPAHLLMQARQLGELRRRAEQLAAEGMPEPRHGHEAAVVAAAIQGA